MGVLRQGLALRVARGFLLVVLSLGVCGMHTLGHLDGRHGDPSTGMHGISADIETLPAGLQVFAPGRDMPGFDPTSVCLAVLTSLLLMVLMTAWVRSRRAVTGIDGPLSPVRQVARPPPEPTSLRLARLSLLRI
ncbi:hypothetical protein [Nonomuraea sp. NEAU-A123]|uniref:hypothetical protein n=1 Tax=Nonomuraea sp. NEAU-A123 TaxID=2839649 RepID=UPI001BE40958|nr:hypothetical protein [Nonomuraea sp. NEAU-A123]MBT2227694.1 hypothetical protein [Nonomuraea sp. NEAU-A123]